MSSTAVGYARISEDDQRTGLGVARQRADIEKLCKREGWDLVEMLIDNDVSASRYSVKIRTEYQRLLTLLRTGMINKVVVYDLDRLLRQSRELEDLIDIAERTPGLMIHSIAGDVRLDSSDGRFVARILVAKAAKESDDLSRRISRKMTELAEDGRPNGGRRPYGFAANRIDHDPTEAAALRRAAAIVLAGGTLTEAARETGLQGPSLKRILISPRIAGKRQHHGEVIGEAVWDPIIDRADWERLRGLLCRPVRYSVPTRRHLLTGFARCGECDHPLSAQWRKNPVRVIYQCRTARGGCGKVSVDGAHLERTVIDDVGKVLASPRGRRRIQRRFDGAPDDREAELVAMIGADEQRLAELAARVGELEISTLEWSAMRRPILERIDTARSELGTIQRRPIRTVDVAAIATGWEAMAVEERRGHLADLGVVVVVARAGKAARRFTADRVHTDIGN